MTKNEALKILFNGETVREGAAIVTFSAGIDSTVLLYLAKQAGLKVIALEFNYAARPSEEIERNLAICKDIHTPLISIAFPTYSDKFSSLPPHNLVESNSLYYALAANFGAIQSVASIFAGQILSDWQNSGITQNQPDFFQRLNANYRDEFGVNSPQIYLPFIHMTKSEVVKLGKELNVPFGLTWSCSNDQNVPCRTCSQCVERQAAFAENGIICHDFE